MNSFRMIQFNKIPSPHEIMIEHLRKLLSKWGLKKKEINKIIKDGRDNSSYKI